MLFKKTENADSILQLSNYSIFCIPLSERIDSFENQTMEVRSYLLVFSLLLVTENAAEKLHFYMFLFKVKQG